MIDSNQFRPQDKKGLFVSNAALGIFNFIAGVIIIALIVCGVLFLIGQFYHPQHTDIYGTLDNITDTNTTQPTVECSNYTVRDDFYYCPIDNVKIKK